MARQPIERSPRRPRHAARAAAARAAAARGAARALGVEVCRAEAARGDAGRDRLLPRAPAEGRDAGGAGTTLRRALRRGAARRARRSELDLGALIERAAGRDALRAYPDAAPALRGAAGGRRAARGGLQLGRLAARAARAHRAAPLVDGAVASAEVGAAKPDPAIFARALALAGARAGGGAGTSATRSRPTSGARGRPGVRAGADRPRRRARGAGRRAPDRLAGRAAGARCVE